MERLKGFGRIDMKVLKIGVRYILKFIRVQITGYK